MVDRPLRIVFFGSPQFAVPSLAELVASSHSIVGVVTQPDRARGRGQKVGPGPVKTFALEHRLPVLQPERLRDPGLPDALLAWQPDLGVVVAYGKLIPPQLLGAPPLGMINVHASLLPRYRGAAPIHRAVIDGEIETGVTIMRVADRLDSGNMLARAMRPIGPDETSATIERDLAQLGARLLLEVVNAMSRNALSEEPQDERLATYAPRLTKEEGRIDWTRSPVEIHNRVRGLFPWPHAFTTVDGERLIILAAEVVAAAGPVTASPGTIVGVSTDAVHVAAGGGGVVAIREVQPEGRRPMAIRDYLAGHPLSVGLRLAG
jgi:methionyl-tRNA formyltransferase